MEAVIIQRKNISVRVATSLIDDKCFGIKSVFLEKVENNSRQAFVAKK